MLAVGVGSPFELVDVDIGAKEIESLTLMLLWLEVEIIWVLVIVSMSQDNSMKGPYAKISIFELT